MPLTEIELELNTLRLLLSEARQWNWLDYYDNKNDAPKDLLNLNKKIDIALKGTGFK